MEFGPKFIWDAPVPAWYFLSFITLAMVAFLFWAKLQPAVQLVARMVSALSFVVGFLALLYAAALPFKMGVDWRVFVPEGQLLDFRFRPTLTLVLLGVAFAGAVMLVRHGIQRRRVV